MISYRIKGSEELLLHHFYRAMAFLGSPLEDQSGKTPFAPRCIKDLVEEKRFDGKWVLTTNMDMPTEQVALKYKELWMVEHVFRQVKSILDTRPIYHKTDVAIRGHVFCSFLALVLRKELDKHPERSGLNYEWHDIKQDLNNLKEITIDDAGKEVIIRTEARGVCSSIFKSLRMALPPTIQKV